MSQKTTRQPDPLFDFDDRAKVNPKHTHICAHCGATGQPQKITKGSLGMELLLWLLFLFPGLSAIPGLLKIQIQSAYYEKLFLTSILSFLACFD